MKLWTLGMFRLVSCFWSPLINATWIMFWQYFHLVFFRILAISDFVDAMSDFLYFCFCVRSSYKCSLTLPLSTVQGFCILRFIVWLLFAEGLRGNIKSIFSVVARVRIALSHKSLSTNSTYVNILRRSHFSKFGFSILLIRKLSINFLRMVF